MGSWNNNIFNRNIQESLKFHREYDGSIQFIYVAKRMAEIDCNGLDEPCVTWTGGVTRTGPRQYVLPQCTVYRRSLQHWRPLNHFDFLHSLRIFCPQNLYLYRPQKDKQAMISWYFYFLYLSLMVDKLSSKFLQLYILKRYVMKCNIN